MHEMNSFPGVASSVLRQIISPKLRDSFSLNLELVSYTKSRALLAACFHADSLFGLLIDPEYGSDMFFRNVG
jgi:hypothetical protein